MCQVQSVDSVVDVLAIVQPHVGPVWVTQETAEVSQFSEAPERWTFLVFQQCKLFRQRCRFHRCSSWTRLKMRPLLRKDTRTAQETVKAPQLQFVDKGVNVPDVEQQQIPKAQTIRNEMEFSQVQYIDKVVPVVRFVQVTWRHAVEKTAEITLLPIVGEEEREGSRGVRHR